MLYRDQILYSRKARAANWDTLFFIYLCLDKNVVDPGIFYRIRIFFLKPLIRVFCPLLKKCSGNIFLKILDISHFFIADAPLRKKIQTFSFIPAPLLGHLVQKYFKYFSLMTWDLGPPYKQNEEK